MIVESGLLKTLWTYAVTTFVVVRNRCFNNRLKQTSYYAVTRRKHDFSKNEYFQFNVLYLKTIEKEIIPKMQKVILVGYDRSTLAYLVYYSENSKVFKHRHVKFINNVPEQQTQIYLPNDENDDVPQRVLTKNPKSEELSNKQLSANKQTNTEEDSYTRRYSKRERNVLRYLEDYVTKVENENDQALFNIDYCYKATCNVFGSHELPKGTPLEIKEATPGRIIHMRS